MLLGRKAMTNLDSILKSRDITFPTKVHLVKAIVFPVVTYECESWTVQKPEHWRTYAFALWCWRRLLRVPWTAKRSNQSIRKEISPGCSLEGLMLKWKLQYLCEELTHWKRPWCWERLKVGEEGDNRGWDGWMASPTQSTWVWVNFGSWWWTGKPGVLQSTGSQRVRHDWVTELNWTVNIKMRKSPMFIINQDTEKYFHFQVFNLQQVSWQTQQKRQGRGYSHLMHINLLWLLWGPCLWSAHS